MKDNNYNKPKFIHNRDTKKKLLQTCIYCLPTKPKSLKPFSSKMFSIKEPTQKNRQKKCSLGMNYHEFIYKLHHLKIFFFFILLKLFYYIFRVVSLFSTSFFYSVVFSLLYNFYNFFSKRRQRGSELYGKKYIFMNNERFDCYN